MKKTIFTVFGFGLIVGALFFGAYAVQSAIQSKVGIVVQRPTNPGVLVPPGSNNPNDPTVWGRGVIDASSVAGISTPGAFPFSNRHLLVGAGMLQNPNAGGNYLWTALGSSTQTSPALGSTLAIMPHHLEGGNSARRGVGGMVNLQGSITGFPNVIIGGVSGTTSYNSYQALVIHSLRQLTNTTMSGAIATFTPYNTRTNDMPALGVLATTLHANLGSQTRRVAIYVTACLVAPVTTGVAEIGTVELFDGADILWNTIVSVSGAADSECFSGNLYIATLIDNRAIHLRFAAAPNAANFQTVTLTSIVLTSGIGN